MSNISLFGTHKDFLSYSLAHTQKEVSAIKKPPWELLDNGILLFRPESKSEHSGLILSAGLHGNETAPIELINELVTKIINGKVEANRPILFILGNPLAMSQGTRFLDFNLNRLFSDNDIISDSNYESERAKRLKSIAVCFESKYSVSLHLDLHTSIRPSYYERFALYPSSNSQPLTDGDKKLLSSMGISAVVHAKGKSSTFSAYTAEKFGCKSFTLELGKVNPFGKNNLVLYQNCAHAFENLVSVKVGIARQQKRRDKLQQYQVTHEILNTGENFEFYVPDDALNFTAFNNGDLIWQDGDRAHRVKEQQEFIIFPNPKVPKGQRVGLMLQKMD